MTTETDTNDYSCKYYNGTMTYVNGSEGEAEERVTVTIGGDVTSVRSMFHYCKQLKSVDGTDWFPAENATTNAYCMFFKDENLETIAGSNNWTLAACKKTGNMFHGCVKLEEISLASLGLNECKSTHGMFQKCTALKNIIGMENWNLSNCESCLNMFYECESIGADKNNAPNFNFTIGSACKNITNMFARCKSLTSINGERWDLSGLEKAHNVFGESGLTSITLMGASIVKLINLGAMRKSSDVTTEFEDTAKYVCTGNVLGLSFIITGVESIDNVPSADS